MKLKGSDYITILALSGKPGQSQSEIVGLVETGQLAAYAMNNDYEPTYSSYGHLSDEACSHLALIKAWNEIKGNSTVPGFYSCILDVSEHSDDSGTTGSNTETEEIINGVPFTVNSSKNLLNQAMAEFSGIWVKVSDFERIKSGVGKNSEQVERKPESCSGSGNTNASETMTPEEYAEKRKNEKAPKEQIAYELKLHFRLKGHRVAELAEPEKTYSARDYEEGTPRKRGSYLVTAWKNKMKL